jgi:hypothetical protein
MYQVPKQKEEIENFKGIFERIPFEVLLLLKQNNILIMVRSPYMILLG